MTVEEIPSDEIIEMTELFHRSFSAAGCIPACHCCRKWIPIGEQFKLSTVKMTSVMERGGGNTFKGAGSIVTKEVMLCEDCTSEKYNAMTDKAISEYKGWQDKTGGGCFRINGKIIH
jgi:hypothetical protein